MNNHLFLFTIGPVQSFIAQARKTQDLYAGSQVLSRLVRAGIEAFTQEFADSTVIFPIFDRKAPESNISLPNRFVAKIEQYGGTPDELKAKAKQVQKAVEAALSTIAKESLSKAGVANFDAFEQQLKGHLDVFWAYQPIDDNFRDAYKALESLVGSVKNVRPFDQYAETGRKCSVDGIGNALFYKPAEENKKPAYVTEEAKPLNTFLLNPGEGLSSVSLIKRFYPNADSFPSTAEVALMHDEMQLTPGGKEMLSCYKMLFNKEKLMETCLSMFKNGWLEKARLVNPQHNEDWYDQPDDYQMLFEENLTSKVMPDATQLELVRNLHGRLKSSFKTKYYALVLFDGDNMGKWLAGENNLTTDNLEEFHREISRRLSDFGSYAREFLNKETGNGYAVFAGGDDFMGFVNLHHLFDVMRKLREQFHEKVNEPLIAFKQADKELTFSAGIVIAHYKTPFSEVLQKARSIEKKAKKEGGRNAFAITVLKHSGEVHEAIYKWDQDESSPHLTSNWMTLAAIVKALDKEDGHFSGKFIQNLSTTFFQLTGTNLHEIDTKNRDTRHLEDAILLEIKRLVSRSLDKKDNPATDKERVETLVKQVQDLWGNTPHPKTRNFIHALHITDFLTRKTNQ